MHGTKQYFVLTVIAGLVFAVIGIFLLGASAITHNFEYLFGGLVGLGIGGIMLWESIPAFIPIGQEFSVKRSCPNCGAVVEREGPICEKCKQPID